MMDHAHEDKHKTLNWENMLHEEKKHFSSSNTVVNATPTTTSSLVPSKVSPIWTKDDIASLRKGIVSLSRYVVEKRNQERGLLVALYLYIVH